MVMEIDPRVDDLGCCLDICPNPCTRVCFKRFDCSDGSVEYREVK